MPSIDHTRSSPGPLDRPIGHAVTERSSSPHRSPGKAAPLCGRFGKCASFTVDAQDTSTRLLGVPLLVPLLRRIADVVHNESPRPVPSEIRTAIETRGEVFDGEVLGVDRVGEHDRDVLLHRVDRSVAEVRDQGVELGVGFSGPPPRFDRRALVLGNWLEKSAKPKADWPSLWPPLAPPRPVPREPATTVATAVAV